MLVRWMSCELAAGPKRQMGDVFNVMAYAAVTTQICVVMFSTYCLLMVAAHAHTPAMLYRALPHSGFLFGRTAVGYVQALNFLSFVAIGAGGRAGTCRGEPCT